MTKMATTAPRSYELHFLNRAIFRALVCHGSHAIKRPESHPPPNYQNSTRERGCIIDFNAPDPSSGEDPVPSSWSHCYDARASRIRR